MDAILERCAGLDVHQETVVASSDGGRRIKYGALTFDSSDHLFCSQKQTIL